MTDQEKQRDTRLDDLLAELSAHPPAPLEPPETFQAQAAEQGVTFEPGDLERIGRYLALMLRVNQAVNLTAVRDADEAWTRHVLDALTLLPLLADLPPEARVIDIGSGGGVPGLPLACVLPGLRLTLLEPTAKKAAFLRHAAAILERSNVEVLADRAERAGRDPERRDGYDVSIARAVGRLHVVAELSLPFVKPGGLGLFIKGAKADEELEEAKMALHALLATHAGTVDTPTGRIVVLEKRRPTPAAFPRRDGEPKRDPIR
ncbi:MAG: 16S rRNA (guanine(527)-N(7))-methyltransferase RsmG [Planctomycetota bacterium]